MLTRVLGRCFDRAIQARGGRYADEGRVRDLLVNADGASAIVRGMVDYRVTVRRVTRAGDAGLRLEAGCTCPFMTAGPGVWGGDGEGGELCKHVWAALVHGEADMLAAWEWARAETLAGEVSIVAVGWDAEEAAAREMEGATPDAVVARIAGGRVVSDDEWAGARGVGLTRAASRVSVVYARIPEGGLVERGAAASEPPKRTGPKGRGDNVA